jgi:hypothetical protein
MLFDSNYLLLNVFIFLMLGIRGVAQEVLGRFVGRVSCCVCLFCFSLLCSFSLYAYFVFCCML